MIDQISLLTLAKHVMIFSDAFKTIMIHELLLSYLSLLQEVTKISHNVHFVRNSI